MITPPVLTLKINFPCRRREEEEGRKDESEEKELGNLGSPVSFVGHRLKVATVFCILPANDPACTDTLFSTSLEKRNSRGECSRGVVNIERTDCSPSIVNGIG
jgi:hypothetical protein